MFKRGAENAVIEIIKVKKALERIESENLRHLDSFLVDDTILLLSEINKDSTIVYIQNYYGSQEEKKELIEEIVSLFNNKEDYLILSWAYVSLDEFPEDKYYDPYLNISEEEKQGKQPIPFDEVLIRESKMLESVGFIDFNDYYGLEFSKGYIYNNKLGNEVINYHKNLSNKGE